MRYLTGPDGEPQLMWAVMRATLKARDYGIYGADGIYPIEDMADYRAERLNRELGEDAYEVVPVDVVVRLVGDDEEDAESIPTVPPGTGTLVL